MTEPENKFVERAKIRTAFYAETKDLRFDDIPAEDLEKYRSVFKHKNSGLCYHCKTSTHYIDLNFQGWVCSPKCQDIKEKEYFVHIKKLSNKYEEL